MPVNLTAPGVYVEEIPRGVHPIPGVSTSIALFVGVCGSDLPAKAPGNRAVRFHDYSTFRKTFGEACPLARYVELFFLNKGSDCFVVRLSPKADLAAYKKAFENPGGIVDKQIDLFNLLILPPASFGGTTDHEVYAAASAFCKQKRAFLLIDPPTNWSDPASIVSGSVLADFRAGLEKQYCAVFYPSLTIDNNGTPRTVGPAGAMAGIVARTDTQHGVWKAPAGVDANVLGISDLSRHLTDGENGLLNPKAVNCLRVFPTGAVNWGARTLDGADDSPSDYKYIPIRRLASYIEESLYRGLKWVVFEPNDEPLLAQIRLNAGAFLHGLFLKGAFQGATAKDAYFVKCDAETTTAPDKAAGRVNLSLGFAPLKPAEFVMLRLELKTVGPHI